MAELQAARDALSHTGEATGRLRLSAPISFGHTHLAAVLAELALRHPRLEIATSYSDRLVDLVGDGFDAAIRLGELKDSSLVARRISPVRSALVASPAYLARTGTPESPEDLVRHETIPHGHASWRFQRKGRTVTIRPRGRFLADTGTAELAAVVAGLGISPMPGFLAGHALARGELAQLLPEWEVPVVGLYVVRPPPAESDPNKVKALTAIMAEKFGRADWDGCPNPHHEGREANI